MLLKECPLCGRTKTVSSFIIDIEDTEKHAVGCGACGCQTAPDLDQNQVIKNWNDRKSPRNHINCHWV